MDDNTHGHSSGHDGDFNNDGIPDNGFPSANAWDDGPDHDHDHDHHHHFHHGFSRGRRRRGYLDLSTAPTWVKVFTWVGALTAIAGFAIVVFGVIGSAGDTFDSVQGNRGLGVGLFLVGFILSTIAGLGHSMSKRR
ncbi:hypothetical protein ALI22I_15220 [Saccharothrix sp. ALI-22-I]|uniref:hypothetical protein n=1 Tax=Saccharothrix sp. ALI-22-I TaxID=1933778 RepID=UPI00097C50BA|nr:hypothetical protein [Saccharothrix sp. ALI-22-I]ONI89383.1 hypothetical protein ALI22I_15220 [Saccharothrix sp. ALI-22-I]